MLYQNTISKFGCIILYKGLRKLSCLLVITKNLGPKILYGQIFEENVCPYLAFYFFLNYTFCYVKRY